MQSWIATEWVAEDGRLHSNQVRRVRTSKLSSMGQPVPDHSTGIALSRTGIGNLRIWVPTCATSPKDCSVL